MRTVHYLLTALLITLVSAACSDEPRVVIVKVADDTDNKADDDGNDDSDSKNDNDDKDKDGDDQDDGKDNGGNDDGNDTGGPSSNSLPVIGSVTISPATPRANSVITATVSGAHDADGDTVQFKVIWRVNGVALVGQSGLTLSGQFKKIDTVQAVVTPNDGKADGIAVHSNTLTVVNSAPTVHNVELSSGAYVSSGPTPPLTVNYETEDADNDTVSVEIRWYRNGAEMTAYNNQTSVPFAALAHGDIWAAGIVGFDDEEATEHVVSAPVLVTISDFDPKTTPAAELWDLPAIQDASTLNATEISSGDCPTNSNYICRDVRFSSPHPAGGASLTTAAWVVLPKTVTKSLAVLIYMHGTGFSRDRDTMVQTLSTLDSVTQMMGPTRQLAVITISGPGEEGSNGPDVETARYQLFPDPRENWDHLFAYVGMRTITYARTLPGVDSAKIGMIGASAGGMATLVANGVDNRLAAAMPLSATGYLLESARQTNSWMAMLATMPASVTLAVDRWIDPRAYLATQHAPVKLVNGAQDEFYPLTSTRLTYENLKSGLAKNLYLVPNFDHGPLATGNTNALTAIATAQAAWLNEYLLGGYNAHRIGAPLATPTMQVNSGNVSVSVAVPALTLNPIFMFAGGTSSHQVTLWASNDAGYTFTSLPMTGAGATFQWSGPASGVWANPSNVVWFVVSEDKITFSGTTFPVDYRSTIPMYPSGFVQTLRPMP